MMARRTAALLRHNIIVALHARLNSLVDAKLELSDAASWAYYERAIKFEYIKVHH